MLKNMKLFETLDHLLHLVAALSVLVAPPLAIYYAIQEKWEAGMFCMIFMAAIVYVSAE